MVAYRFPSHSSHHTAGLGPALRMWCVAAVTTGLLTTPAGAQLATRITRRHRTAAQAADSLFRAGEHELAASAYERLLSVNPSNIYAAWRRGHALLGADRCQAAQRQFAAVTREPEYRLMAHIHQSTAWACLGELDSAFSHLRNAVEMGYATVDFGLGDLVNLRTSSGLNPLRDDPRFATLIGEITERPIPTLVRAPAWSPDGREIVFSGMLNGNGNFDLWVIRDDGTGLRRLTNSLHDDHDPDWSPQGDDIVFSRLRSTPVAGADLYLIRPDGSSERRFTNGRTLAGDKHQPRWTPDGGRIVFSTSDDGTAQIYSMAPNGGDVLQLTEGAGNKGNPAVSPSGTLLYDMLGTRDEYRVYAIAPDHQPTPLLVNAWWRRPAFSPDGAHLLVSYFDTGPAQFGHVAVMRADGSERRLLLPDTIGTSDGAWSPDGERIAFVRAYQPHLRGGSALYVIGRDGSGARRLVGKR